MTKSSWNKILIIVYAILSIAIAAFILANGATDGETSYEYSSTAVDIAVKVVPPFGELARPRQVFLIRRLAHIVEYSCFGFCFSRFLVKVIGNGKNKKKKNLNRTIAFLISMAASIGLASCDELLIQVQMSGRTGTIKDVFFDAIAFTIAILVSVLLK